MKKIALVALVAAQFSFASAKTNEYEFPYKNPYKATVFGTPREMRFTYEGLPEIEDKTVEFKAKERSDIFFYEDVFKYQLIKSPSEEKGLKSSLVFIIAGTGSTYKTENVQELAKYFASLGNYVALISSPTTVNFITTASSTSVPGDMLTDAKDLLNVFTKISDEVGRENISSFKICGYSLGGMNSAFAHYVDQTGDKRFNFEQVLMLNPPVKLIDSINRLDSMIDKSKQTPAGMYKLVDQVAYKVRNKMSMSTDPKSSSIKDVFMDSSDSEIKELIGLSFRFSSMNMLFSSDVLTNSGVIVPKNTDLGTSDSVEDYFFVATKLNFLDYFNHLMYPYYRQKMKVTKDELINKQSLQAINDFLVKTKNISVITNQDDFILNQADINYLNKTFQGRIKVFPHGGHCGNIPHKAYLEQVGKFMSPKGGK